MRLSKAKRDKIEQILKSEIYENSDLTSEQKDAMWDLVSEFQDIFVLAIEDLIPADVPPFEIDVQGAKPISVPPRRTSPEQRDEIWRQAAVMIKNKILRYADSGEWSFPGVLVNKRDGSKRWVVDYRRLNEVTKKDIYSPGNIDDALDLLGKMKYASIYDMCGAYLQIPLSKESQKYATVRLPSGELLSYTTLNFGLCNAVAGFSRMVDSVYHDLKWKCMFPYLDDILIFSESFEEHLEHTRAVLQRTRERGLQMKASKATIARAKMRYLGFLVTAGKGISVDPENLDKIKRFPVPKNKKEAKSFGGLCSYYRRLISGFARIFHPINEVAKLNAQFKWGPEQQKAFETLRDKLSTAPVLALPDFSREFFLQCDASNIALGAVLSQYDDQNIEHPVVYISRKLTPTEQKYDVRSKEALCIVWAVRRLRPYLISKPFTIFSDHQSLEFLRNHTKPDRLSRYHLMLQNYNFVIKYRPGNASHQNCDTLSRVIYDGYLKSDEPNEDTLDFFNVLPLRLPSKEELRLAQENDSTLSRILDYLKGKIPCTPSIKEHLSGVGMYHIADDSGLLRITVRNKPPRVVVPFALRNLIMRACHDTPSANHHGLSKTLQRVRQTFYWENMSANVASFVRGCLKCQKRKPPEPKRHGQLMTFPSDGPFMSLALDLSGTFPESDDGYVAVAVWMCKFTRWIILSPVKDHSAREVSRALVRDVIANHSCPRIIYSDLGRNFVSKLFRYTSAALGISSIWSSAHHHSTQGNVEKFMWLLKNSISFYVDKGHRNWPDLLPGIEFAYRTSVIEGLQFTPFELLYGRPPNTPLQFLYGNPTQFESIPEKYQLNLLSTFRRIYKSTRDAQAKMDVRKARYYNRAHIPVQFEIGSLCLLWTPPTPKQGETRQFLAKYTGPHKVLEKLNSLNYQIEDVKTKKKQRVHVQRMIKYHPHLISDADEIQEPPAEIERDNTAPALVPQNSTPPTVAPVDLPAPQQPSFEFVLPNGLGKIIHKSVENGRPKYLVEGPSGIDWVRADELPMGVTKSYELAYRTHRRNRRART